MTTSIDRPVLDTQLTADLCVKCNICTAACPVAAVTEMFPGPKVVGPQAQRFRAPGAPVVDQAVDYCSACGVCSRVCPHGIQIAEMNVVAKARLAQQRGLPLRNRILGRSEIVGRLGSWFAPLSDVPIQNKLLRRLAERVLGVARDAAFPRFARQSFRAWVKQQAVTAKATEALPKVVYFHGCSTNYYEPRVGQAAVAVLRHLGCEVVVAEQNCCGLPMQSNGEFDAARRYARGNLSKLAPFARQGYVIVGTSTSCTLTFKHEYRAVLGLAGEELEAVSNATYDFFEFLQMLDAAGQLKTDFRPVARAALVYHAPCQFRAHGVGKPAADLLRRIPGVTVSETQAECCGVAGTYGLKAEKYQIAVDVGRGLFREIRDSGAPTLACDSETCRWWLAQHTGLPAVHPVEILAEAYGL
ncbi:MAG: anaerobic glycerol-3-phosphate dehydrogenase subunit C [Anaerolineales bacterium]|nr:anaerobic glycerol-3-phosphate dehydrogenase subunit C [Anaerolineales bacterium]